MRNSSPMHLPIVGKRVNSIVNNNPDRLYTLLTAPGALQTLSWYGQERLMAWEDDILVAQTQGFRRYIYGLDCVVRLPNGNCQLVAPETAAFATAGLEVRLAGKGQRHPLIERIYVVPERRRQGIATAMVLRALRDFPDLVLDGKLTPDGAALFGYKLRH